MPGPVIPDHLATVCHCCPWKGRNTPDVLKQFQLSSGLATLDLSAAFYAVGHQPNMVGVGISGITTTDYNNISLQWGNIVIRVAVISLYSDNSEHREWYKVIIITITGHPHYQQCVTLEKVWCHPFFIMNCQMIDMAAAVAGPKQTI